MTNAVKRKVQVHVFRRFSEIVASGDAVNEHRAVGTMWVEMAPTSVSRLLLADVVLRDRTSIVAISDAAQDFAIPVAGDLLVDDRSRVFFVEGAFDVDELHRTWHVALSEYEPDFEVAEDIGNVVEDYAWQGEYWASDADESGLLTSRSPAGFPDLQSAQPIAIGVSTAGLLASGLPAALVNGAFQPINNTAPHALGTAPPWGEDIGFVHFRAILYLNDIPPNNFHWYLQEGATGGFVYNRSLLNILQATLGVDLTRSLNVPAVKGWVLADFVFARGYYRWRVNGVEASADTDDQVWLFDATDVCMGGSRTGAVIDPGARFLFWGYRTLDHDPGFQEHIDDVIRLRENVLDRYEWQEAYSCEDADAGGLWATQEGEQELDTDGNAPRLDVDTDGLNPAGIGAARVNKAVGVPTAQGWTRAGWSTDITGPWHLRILARIRISTGNWVHQYRLDPNQLRLSLIPNAYQMQVYSAGGTTGVPSPPLPDGGWALTDIVHDGVNTSFMVNGVVFTVPTVGPPITMVWDVPAPFALGDNTGAINPTDADLVFYGLRPIAEGGFTEAEHARDVEDLGLI